MEMQTGIEKGTSSTSMGRLESIHIDMDKTSESTSFMKHWQYLSIRGRVHAIDNLRTTLVVLIVLQHAVLYTISNITEHHIDVSQMQYSILMLFVGLNKTVVVGMLYFVSGFGSACLMNTHIHIHGVHSSFRYTFEKTARIARYIVGHYFAAIVIRRICVSKQFDTDISLMRYWTLREGRSALLAESILFLLLLLVFDYLYATTRTLNRHSDMIYKRIIFFPLQYHFGNVIAVAFMTLWTISITHLMLNPPARMSSFMGHIAQTNLDPHLLAQYAIAYLAGVNFFSFANFTLTEETLHVRNYWYKATLSLYLSFCTLFAIYRGYPTQILQVIKIEALPDQHSDQWLGSRSRSEEYTIFSVLYGLWTTATFLTVSSRLIQLAITSPSLNKSWVLHSRSTLLQPSIHICIFVGVGTVILKTPGS
ncbi:hypothetical protein CVT25_004070 [Psilocybe cyanescens]|uniref:Uncharacterized protein n=1 Tax=Psilocybe cyanescens TaxID=93625 RepID=A0A409XPU3_PSICY|nr:hypothetical protein CVT25_004070 [Psilocybe cyanescens]